MTSDALFAAANAEWEAGHLKRAVTLLHRAHDAGSAYAANTIGYFYDNGIGVRKSGLTALEWYKRGARRGDICAVSNVAVCYRQNGNNQLARRWFFKALDGGDDDAALQLAKLLIETPRPSKSGFEQARKYILQALKSTNLDEDSRLEAADLLSALPALIKAKP